MIIKKLFNSIVFLFLLTTNIIAGIPDGKGNFIVTDGNLIMPKANNIRFVDNPLISAIPTNSVRFFIDKNKILNSRRNNGIWNDTSLDDRNTIYIDTLEDLENSALVITGSVLWLPNANIIFTDNIVIPYNLFITFGVTPRFSHTGVISLGTIVFVGSGTFFSSDYLIGSLFERLIVSGLGEGANQTLWDLTSLGGLPFTPFLQLKSVIFQDFDHMGELNGVDYFHLDTQANFMGTGLKIRGDVYPTNLVFIDNANFSNWYNVTTNILEFRGTINSIDLNSAVAIYNSNMNMYNFTPTLNTFAVRSSSGALIENPLSPGGRVFAVDSLDQKDPRFNFNNTAGVADSTIALSLITTGNSDYTTIAASDTPVTMNIQSLVIHTDEERLVVSTANNTVKVTYIGLEDARIGVGIKADVNVGIAAQKLLAVYIAKNDEVIETSEKKDRVLNVSITISTDTKVNLSTNDYLTFYVENETDTQDILVSKLIITI